MDTFVHLGLLNAALAAILALVAAAARCLCRRPAVVHALWLLVLLKLLTPPFLAVPVGWLPLDTTPKPSNPPVLGASPSADEDTPGVPVEPAVTVELPEPLDPSAVSDGKTAPLGESRTRTTAPTVEPPDAVSREETPSEVLSPRPSWESIVAAVWLTGAGVWWAVAGLRLYGFRKSLRAVCPAPIALQQQAERLAARLGLSRCPRVYLLPARTMPLLWAVVGEPCLLLPAVLWARLTDAQQETLLVHELAHLRRGDPWVRRLEIAVLGLYWWHPVAWWARHELQEAEEQCCDAWVLWALPAAAETYATALLQTVAFLSRLRPALPLGASGAGHTYLLRRRLTMIFRGTAPRALSWTGLAALSVGAIVLLPLRPSWAQDQPSVSRSQEPATTPIGPSTIPIGPSTISVGQQATPSTGPKLSAPVDLPASQSSPAGLSHPRDIEEAKDTVELLQAQLEAKKAELLEARALVEQGRRQLERHEKLTKTGAISTEEIDQQRTEVAVREARLRAKEAQVKEAELRLRQANRWLSRLQGGTQPHGGTRAAPTSGAAIPSIDSETTTPAVSSTTGRTSTVPVPAGPGGAVPKGIGLERSATPGDSEQRMRDLEMKLDKLLKEVESLRREIRRQPQKDAAPSAERAR